MLALISLATAVSLQASDGRAVPASWQTGGDRAPVMILVADEGSSTDEWLAIAGALAKEGISTLSVATRASKSPENTVKDVETAIAWVRARKDADVTRLAITGAGYGGLAALAAACDDPNVDAVALVSAPVDTTRLDDEDAMSDFGKRPLFLAVARGDKRPAKSALVFDANAKGPKKLVIAEGSRTGAELVTKHEETRLAYVQWSRDVLGVK